MFDRLRTAITSQPWRTAAVALGSALILSLISLAIAASGGGDNVSASPISSTTTTKSSGSTSTKAANPTTSTTDSSSTTTRSSTSEPARPLLLGVRIDNAPQARPQWGLNAAALLIEYPVEGGITRFTAIFRSGTIGLAGPVRSLRPVDGNLLSPLTDVLATSGGQDFVIRDIVATGIEVVVAQLSSLFPSVGNPDPYDTFVDLSLLDDFAAGREFGPVGLPSGQVPSGDPVDSIEMPFGDTSFVYDPGTGYTRLVGTNAFSVLDLAGENLKPLIHDTLVVLFAAERPAGYSDVNGVPVSTFDVIGSGRLLVFTDGQVVDGIWQRSAQEDPYVFLDAEGVEFGLREGRTYLAIVARDLEVVFE